MRTWAAVLTNATVDVHFNSRAKNSKLKYLVETVLFNPYPSNRVRTVNYV